LPGATVDHQGDPERAVDALQALEVLAWLTAHTSMDGADGHREEMRPGTRHGRIRVGHEESGRCSHTP
jgi:hypothetical protein